MNNIYKGEKEHNSVVSLSLGNLRQALMKTKWKESGLWSQIYLGLNTHSNISCMAMSKPLASTSPFSHPISIYMS